MNKILASIEKYVSEFNHLIRSKKLKLFRCRQMTPECNDMYFSRAYVGAPIKLK